MNKFLTKEKLLSIFLFIILTALIFLPIFFKDQLHHFRTLGLLGLFFINFFASATIFLPAPAILSVPIFSHIYNPYAVAITAAVGSSLGETTAFFFGTTSKAVIKKQQKNKIFKFLHAAFEKYGGLLLLIAAIIPNPLIDGLGIIAGFSSYPISKFLFFTFCGRIIRNLLLVTFPALIPHLR